MPKFIVGDETRPDFVHPGDIALTSFKGKICRDVIKIVGSDGLLFFGDSLYPFGTTVKISCPHKLQTNPQH